MEHIKTKQGMAYFVKKQNFLFFIILKKKKTEYFSALDEKDVLPMNLRILVDRFPAHGLNFVKRFSVHKNLFGIESIFF